MFERYEPPRCNTTPNLVQIQQEVLKLQLKIKIRPFCTQSLITMATNMFGRCVRPWYPTMQNLKQIYQGVLELCIWPIHACHVHLMLSLNGNQQMLSCLSLRSLYDLTDSMGDDKNNMKIPRFHAEEILWMHEWKMKRATCFINQVKKSAWNFEMWHWAVFPQKRMGAWKKPTVSCCNEPKSNARLRSQSFLWNLEFPAWPRSDNPRERGNGTADWWWIQECLRPGLSS